MFSYDIIPIHLMIVILMIALILIQLHFFYLNSIFSSLFLINHSIKLFPHLVAMIFILISLDFFLILTLVINLFFLKISFKDFYIIIAFLLHAKATFIINSQISRLKEIKILH